MSNTDRRRRILGAVFLLAAVGMLVVGQTLLKDRLGTIAFVIYWMACFAFTMLAVLVAFVDATIVNRRARAEQREFIESAVREIEQKRAAKNQKTDEPSGGGG